jgi:hypothetical protein
MQGEKRRVPCCKVAHDSGDFSCEQSNKVPQTRLQDPTNDNANCGVCGNVCPAGQSCLNGVCAEDSVPCNGGVSFNGEEGTYTYSVTIGTAGPLFTFNYNGNNQPDRFTVKAPDGTVLFTKLAGLPGNPSQACICPACASEETFPNGSVILARPIGVSTVQVIVNGYCGGTIWDFQMTCAA